MSERRMEQVEVFVGGNGHLCIAVDEDLFTEHRSVILLCPEQIDLVVKWMRELKPLCERARAEFNDRENTNG